MGAKRQAFMSSAPASIGPDEGRWRHFVHVTRALTTTEFKLRYFGSVLGYFWTLLRPLMLFGVLYVVFTHIVRFGDRVDHYPVVLLAAIVVFNFFSEATSGGLGSFVARENLLRKVYFPRAAVPISVALTAAANLVLGVVVVLLFAVIDGVTPSATWLLFVGAALAVVVFATAISLLLAVLFVRYRDMQPIWEVALQMLFYASPVIYVTTALPDSIERESMASPITAVLTQMRYALIDPSAPTAADLIGGTARLLIPLGIVVIVFVLGVWVFMREAPRIAENL
jgi:ABC-2 type transport system permease protein